MSETISFYEGAANAVTLTLKKKTGTDTSMVTVTASTLTRAVFRFGDYCVDTDEVTDSDMIAFTEDETKLVLKLGLISGVTAGNYRGLLSCYDDSDDPTAWETYTVEIKPWESACDAE